MKNRAPFYYLFFFGIAVASVGIAFSPAFVVRYFRPAGIHSTFTLIKVYAIQISAIAAGLALSSYSVLRITNSPLSHRVHGAWLHGSLTYGLDFLLALILLPFVLYDVQRIVQITPMGYNEGWNAYHTMRFLHGGPLYLPLDGFPVNPNNYPPLSFLIIGTLIRLAGHPMLTGRLVAFAAFFCVAVLVFRAVYVLTRHWTASVLGGLLWLMLMVRVINGYVGMYDPQMLGHVFTVGALTLYVEWRGRLTVARTTALAVLCVLGLFVKPLLVPVPVTLAFALLLTEKRQAGVFVLAGIVATAAMLLGSWLAFGRDFFTDILLNLGRRWGFEHWREDLRYVLVTRGAAALLTVFAAPLLWVEKKWLFLLVYLSVSLGVPLYYSGVDGVSINVWFDFLIATSVVVGLLVGRLMTLPGRNTRVAAWVIVIACLGPCLPYLKADLEEAFDHTYMREQAPLYRDEVQLFRSTPGPALFRIPSLGFDSGKEFLFAPFDGTELILTGRVPERTLTDRIRDGEFSLIALSIDLTDALRMIDASKASSREPRKTGDWWTDNTLIAISKRYRLLNHRYSYVYVPR